MMKLFDCDDVGNMDEYVGYKINGDDCFTFTQPVMLQSFRNEFALPKRVPISSAMAGKTLSKTEEDVDTPEETSYIRN